MKDIHKYKSIELRGEIVDIDINIIDLIKNLNQKKLITCGYCENWSNDDAYIIFEVNSLNELLKNNLNFKNFVKSDCIKKSEIYYNLNTH